jgi:hypothetical protein
MARFPLPFACFLALLLPCAPRALAQCSHWSTGFEAPGVDGVLSASIVFDDGSGPALYVAGEFAHAPGVAAKGVAKWNGTAWSAVGSGLEGSVYALTVFDDGSGPKLTAAGFLRNSSLVYEGSVFQWSGSQWTQLGPSLPVDPNFGDTTVYALAVFDDGAGPKLYVGGGFSGAVRRWNGQSYEVVGGGLFQGAFDSEAQVFTFATFDDGSGPQLYAGGEFTRVGSPWNPQTLANTARLSNGAWTSPGSGLGEGRVLALCAFDDGSGPALYAGGDFELSATTGHMARLVNGAWVLFASDVDASVASLATFGAGSGVPPGLWVGGWFTHAGGQPARGLARWSGGVWHAQNSTSMASGGAVLAAFDDVTGHGSRAFAAGRNGIVQVLDGVDWSLVHPGGGANAAVGSLCVVHGATTELWATGGFEAIGGVPAHTLARFDGESWHEVGLPGTTATPGRLFALDVGAGEELYLTGRFTGLGPAVVNVLRRSNGTWIPLPPVPVYPTSTPSGLAVFDAGDGKHVYACGAYGIWRLDGSAWTNLSGLLDQPAYCMSVFDDGSGPALYIGGQFSQVAGVTHRTMVRWDGSAFSDLGGTSNNGTVYAMHGYDDGNGPALYVTGVLYTMGGLPCAGLAKWDGHAWSSLFGGIQGVVPYGLALAVHDDGSGNGDELVVGSVIPGSGPSMGGIARWNGSAWRTMDGGVAAGAGTTYAGSFAVLDMGDGHGGDLYVGGHFVQAGMTESSNLGVWRSCGGDATTFCYGDGSGAACPCGNASAVGDRAGCLSSLGIGGTLRVHGRASLGDDTLVLEGGSMPNSSVLYFQGANVINGGAGVVFGDGVKCTSGPFVRLGTKSNVDGASVYPGAADPMLSVRGMITTAGTRHYQARYRNSAPFCTPDTFNYTSGVSVAWSN